MNSETRNCINCKKDFTIEPEDFNFYEKIGVPAPTWCPECRFIRKTTFINERSLYKGTCGNCKKSIISMYHPDLPLPVWCPKCYLSDILDARNYAQDYDFSKSFLEQFKELKFKTPHRSLDQNERNGEGCEYANYCYTSKNVYLSFFTTGGSENIKYSKCHFKNNKNCVDCWAIKDNDRGYELVRSGKNFNSSFLVESDQCIESNFLFDCSNCVNCCLSSNIRNKSFYFRNQQLSREEYKKAIENLHLETYSGQMSVRKEFEEMANKAIHRHANIKNSINVFGDFIENSKNIYHCADVLDGENIRYSHSAVRPARDSYDILFTGKLGECYEATLAGRGGNRLLFSFSCGGGSINLFYCDSCRGCADCFGCMSLSNKQYCILNKQYTKEEYFKMIGKIKVHMKEMPFVDSVGRKYGFGESFPTEISPFAYNETLAFQEQPLSKEEIVKAGYKWREPEVKNYSSTIKSEDLPDSIVGVKDEICNEIIGCPNGGDIKTQCVSAYKILPDELQFYRQMKIPLPRYCPNCRYYDRLKWKNPFRFYKRECMCGLSNHVHKNKCQNEFETMYAPERTEKIFCKECYQAEVY